MRLKTIILSVCLVTSHLFSQTGNLLGTVTDSNGSFPLPGANVYLEGTNFGGITDSGGKVYLSNLPAGNYKLVVSYIGYENQKKDISIDAESLNTFAVELSVGTLVGNDIDVIGNSLSGQARALNNQKNKSNISNVISSDQVGKFPDSNIGDALKRVPGIAVYNDMGEARFGHVRGTPSSFNSATINGERMPSAESTTRSNQLDLIPADMIQTVEVIKALTPDMDADAIGGSINLITRKAAGTRTSVTVGRGDNTLDQAGKIVQLSGMHSNRSEDSNFGYMFNFSFYDKWTGSDNVEAEWDDEGNIVEHDIRKYLVHRERKSLGLRFDYNLGNTELYTDLNYNDRDDYENRYRQRIKDLDEGEGSQEVRRQTKAGLPGNEYGRLEDQKLFSYKFGGTSLLDKLKLDYSFKISEASELRPNERYLALRLKKQTAVWNQSTEKPNFTFTNAIAADLNNSWDFRNLIEERRDTDEKAQSFKVDADYNFNDNLKLEAGLKISSRKKERRNEFYEFEPVDEDAFLADAFSNIVSQDKSEWLNDGDGTSYNSGSYVSREFLGNLDLSNTELFERVIVEEELAGNFKASEDITSFYGMASYDYSDQLLVVGGIRFERTSLNDLGLTTLSNIIPVSTYYTFWYGKGWNDDDFDLAVQLSSGNYLLYGDDKMRETLNFYDSGWNRSVGMTKNDCNSFNNRSDNIENATVSEQAFNFDGQILSINHKNEHILTSHSNAFHVKDYDYNTILTVENSSLYGDNRGYALSHDGGIIFLDWSNEKSIIKYNQNGNEEWKTTNFWSSNFLYPELLSLPSGETIVVFVDSPDGENDNNDNKRRILKIDNQGNIIHDSSFTQRSGDYRMKFANNNFLLIYKDDLRTTGEQLKMDIIDATSFDIINTVNLNSFENYVSSIGLENGNIIFLSSTGLNFDIHIFDSNGYTLNHFENILGCDMSWGGLADLKWIIPTIDGGFLVSGGSTIIKFDPNFEFLQKAIHPSEYGL